MWHEIVTPDTRLTRFTVSRANMTDIYIYIRLSGTKHNLLFDFVTAYRFVCPSHSTTVCFHGIWKFDGENGFLSVSFQRLSSSPLFSQTDCLLSRYQLDPVQMVKMVTFIRKIISFNFGSNLKSWRPRLFFFDLNFRSKNIPLNFITIKIAMRIKCIWN